MTEPNYFQIRRFRKEVTQRFLEYPLTSDRDGSICARLVPACRKILEIGAGDRSFVQELRQRGFEGEFKTMDVDPGIACDYYSVEEIGEVFDAVIMREVVEHVPRMQLYAYLDKIFTILRPGGWLIISTPNPWASNWVFADYTHISPWPPADLYSVLRWQQFRPVEIQRVIWPSRYLWLKRLYWALHSRCYDIDFAGSYLAFARKPLVEAEPGC